MPPRKGIVKTGNAGNSSKTNKNSGAGLPSQSADAEREKPLFPPGSKYPLSLLQERYGLCMLFRIRCRSFVALENESRALAYPATSRAAGFKANFPIHRCQKSGWDKPTVETVSECFIKPFIIAQDPQA